MISVLLPSCWRVRSVILVGVGLNLVVVVGERG